MKIRREDLCLYAVTDRSWLGSARLYDQVEKALKGGATMIQLREKNLEKNLFRRPERLADFAGSMEFLF